MHTHSTYVHIYNYNKLTLSPNFGWLFNEDRDDLVSLSLLFTAASEGEKALSIESSSTLCIAVV